MRVLLASSSTPLPLRDGYRPGAPPQVVKEGRACVPIASPS
jgi:hypothetical protein